MTDDKPDGTPWREDKTPKKEKPLGFYGNREIIGMVDSITETYMGNPMKELVLNDKKVVLIPEAMLDEVITEKISDLTTLRMSKSKKTIQKVLAVLAEDNVSVKDVQYVLETVTESLNESIKAAADKMWDKDSKELTTLDIDNKLK